MVRAEMTSHLRSVTGCCDCVPPVQRKFVLERVCDSDQFEKSVVHYIEHALWRNNITMRDVWFPKKVES